MKALKTVFTVKIIKSLRESRTIETALNGVRQWLKEIGVYRR